MDWHASVYGSRSGGGQYRDFSDGDADDDGITYGARGSYADMADDTAGAAPLTPSVDAAELRRLGGNAVYFRAKDVLKSGRMHDMAVSFNVPDSPRTSGTMLTGARANVRLTALVKGADRYADDYRVSAAIDTDAGKVGQSSCTCPAYGRFRGVCKHVIALVMAYNEHPDDFAAADDGNGSTNGIGRGAAGLVPWQPAVRTTRALDLFMRQQDDERTRKSQSRQLDLLKEIGGLADSGGVAGAAQTARFMPIASVSLRLSLSFSLNSCVAKFRIEVPSRGISYVVKDIASLLQSVKNREFVAYGKKLAFVHSRDAFDERSRNLLDVLSRAQDIRAVINNDNSAYSYYYRRQSDDATLTLSDGEVAELLDTYVGTEDTVEYTAPARFYAPTMRVSVVDGNPDLGLAVERGDDPEASNGSTAAAGYVIRHAQRVERFIEGQRSHYVIARPFSQAESGAGVGSGGRALLSVDRATIYRCDADFAQKRALLSLLCGENDREAMYLSESDVDRFVRTVLPQLVSRQENEAGRSVDAIGASAGPNAEDGSAASSVFDRLVPPAGRETGVPAHGGLIIDVPPELLAKMRVPCRLAFYLDRDRAGVTCDAQAHYGDKHYHVFNGVGVDASMRDKEMERLAVEAMLHYFPRPSGAVAAIPESDDEAIYRLLTEGLAVLRGLGDVMATPAFDGLTAMPRPTISIGLSVKSGLVEISPIADEIDPDDVPGLLASYRRRRRFHRLRNGSFVDMRNVDMSDVDEIADDLGLRAADLESGSITVPAYEAYYLDHQVDDDAKDASFTAYLDGLRVIDPSTYRVPAALASVLRPYQVEGFRWLNAVCDKGFGGILADEMGLGKSVQLLSLLLARHKESRAEHRPNLIVCPASLVYNWVAEVAKHTPELRVEAIAGTKPERRAMLDGVRAAQQDTGVSPTRESARPASATAASDDVPDVLVTSYDLLRRDIDDYAGLEFYCMTLDEAQYIKNAATKVSKAVRSVTAVHRFALTGTPIENRLSELWSIFDFLMPGMLGSYAHFRERFEMPVLSGDETAQKKLQSFVGPFILRRLKSQVLKDLPDKIENVITVQLQGEQRKLYAALEQQLRSVILRQRPADFNTGKIQILAQLTRLRQVCCDPRLIYENADGHASALSAGVQSAAKDPQQSVKQPVKQSKARKTVSSAKLDAIIELVDSCRDAEQDADLLAVHQLPRPDRATVAGRRRGIRHDHRSDAEETPSGAGGPVQRRRDAGVPDLAQGGKHGPEPDRRMRGRARRSVVERGRAGSGHRSRPPHRPDTGRQRVSDRGEGHDRGAHPQPPAQQDRPRATVRGFRVLRHRTVDGRAHQGRPARPAGLKVFPHATVNSSRYHRCLDVRKGKDVMSVRKKLMSVVAAVATAAAMGATGVAANAADVVAVPQEGLSDTGASIAIVVVLVVVLAAIGVGVTVARKRQSATGAHVQGEDEGADESGLVADGADTADTQTVQSDDAAPAADDSAAGSEESRDSE